MPHDKKYQIASRTEALYHTSLEYEHIFCAAVASGNVAEVERLSSSMVSGGFVVGKVSDDPVRQIIYLVINGAAVMIRAAISGGLSQEEAFCRSDNFIYTIDKINDVNKISELYNEFVIELTTAVRKQKYASHNPYARRAVRYIEYNIEKKLTVREIADAIKVTPNYLSTVFVKDMGESLSSFIIRKKLDEAVYLLLNTNKSCLAISNQLSFASQSYFILKFKELYGVTPNQYRAENSDI